MGHTMTAATAINILERAWPGGWKTRSADNHQGATELGVFKDGRYIGRLEQGTMDEQAHPEIFMRPGQDWKPEYQRTYTEYIREGWKRCMGLIMCQLPEHVKARAKKLGRKLGYAF